MFDIQAFEDAGFTKQLTEDEWRKRNDSMATFLTRQRRDGLPGDVRIDYILERRGVRVTVEQNTQTQAPYGIETVVHYPQVAVVSHESTVQQVSCDASDTELILAVVDDLEMRLEERQVLPATDTPPPP